MFDLRKLWREPLIHFLVIGTGFFLASGLMQDQDANAPNRIVVDAGQVEQLTAQFTRTWLRPPTGDELAGLIESHVRDEVYYREALAMGLDKNDPQVRRRMRLKLEFLLEDLTPQDPPRDDVLNAYLEKHQDQFRIEPKISFAQVYLAPDKHPELVADAERILADLRAGAAPENLGDPTMLPHEQSAMSTRAIARTFGDAFAREVAALEPGTWEGPLYSGLGAHLVRITDRAQGRLPDLAEVRAEVEREYLAQRRQEIRDLAYRKLR